MEDKLYLLECKQTKRKVCYAFVEDTPVRIYLNKNKKLDCILGQDKEAENAIFGKDSKYTLISKADFNSNSNVKATYDHIRKHARAEKFKNLVNKYYKSQELMKKNEYGGFQENVLEHLRLVKINADNNYYDGFKNNLFAILISKNN